MLEHGQNGKIVGGLFFSCQNRQLHVRHECMTHLVGGHKKHIADEEFDHGLLLVWGDAFEAWFVCKRARLLIDPGLE